MSYTHDLRVKDTANALYDRFEDDSLEAAENAFEHACGKAAEGIAGWAKQARLYADVVIYIRKALSE